MKKTLFIRIMALALVLCILMLGAGCRKSKNVGETSDYSSDYSSAIVDETSDVTDASSEDASSTDSASSGAGESTDVGTSSVQSGSGSGGSTSVSGGLGGKTMSREFLNSLKGMTINVTELYSENPPEKGTALGNMYFSNLSKIGNKYGCTINYVNTALSQEAILSSFLSGQPAVDVFSIQDYTFAPFVKAGACADLTAAMKELNLNLKEEWYDSNVTKFYNINNKQLAWDTGLRNVMMIAYNKRIITENGLEDPYKLYQSGKWTYEKMAEYAEKMLVKGKDGTTQQWGLMTPNVQTFFEYLVHNNGGSLIDIKNGHFSTDNMSNKKTIEALNFFYDWYVGNKIMEIGMTTWQEPYDTFIAGKIGMFLTGDYLYKRIQEKGGMSDTVGVVPFPKGPSGQNVAECYIDCWPTAIAKGREKDAAKYLFIMNEIAKLEYQQQETKAKTLYGSVIRDATAYKAYLERLTNKVELDLTFMKMSGTIHEDGAFMGFSMRIFADGQTPASAVSSYKKSIVNVADDIWGDITFTGK